MSEPLSVGSGYHDFTVSGIKGLLAATCVEFEGQGHGIRGFDNLVRYHQAVFDFFETVSAENKEPH